MHMIDFNNHPCFNIHSVNRYGRLHLPIAPLSNIQCNYCNRKTDCVNEARPGVSSRILSSSQAIEFLAKRYNYVKKNISVIGVAGPGDPMATPQITLETFEKVREMFPDVILCLSTNGVNLVRYIPNLIQASVSHITVTINAVDYKIGKKIYQWCHDGYRYLDKEAAAEYIINNQLDAVGRLKENGIEVKINTVVIPNVNDGHVIDIAKRVSQLKADVQNCIGLIPLANTPFANNGEPTYEEMLYIRSEASKHIRQIYHCNRCRADACGLLK